MLSCYKFLLRTPRMFFQRLHRQKGPRFLSPRLALWSVQVFVLNKIKARIAVHSHVRELQRLCTTIQTGYKVIGLLVINSSHARDECHHLTKGITSFCTQFQSKPPDIKFKEKNRKKKNPLALLKDIQSCIKRSEINVWRLLHPTQPHAFISIDEMDKETHTLMK